MVVTVKYELEQITQTIRARIIELPHEYRSVPSTYELGAADGDYILARKQLTEDRNGNQSAEAIAESERVLVYRTKQLLLSLDTFRRDTQTGIDEDTKQSIDERIDWLIDQSFLHIAYLTK